MRLRTFTLFIVKNYSYPATVGQGATVDFIDVIKGKEGLC